MTEMNCNSDTTNIPLCAVCKHHHVQGIKCPICSHVGKSSILQKMKMKLELRSQISYNSYSGEELFRFQQNKDSLTDEESLIRFHYFQIWQIIYQLRLDCLCFDFGISPDIEFVEVEEFLSSHCVCRTGDMVVLIARYRVITNENTIIIDKIAVSAQYRHKGYLKLFIKYLLNIDRDCKILRIEAPTQYQQQNAWLWSKLQQISFSQNFNGHITAYSIQIDALKSLGFLE